MKKKVTWHPRDSNLGPLACHAEDPQHVATQVTLARPTIPWVYMTWSDCVIKSRGIHARRVVLIVSFSES